MGQKKLNLEETLEELVSANEEENRFKTALEWKRQGGKIIGTLCSYVPEEIIYAAGMFPFRITGTLQKEITLASVYRPSNCCLYNNHVTESLLTGQLDFLDGVVFTNQDDDRRRLYDLFVHLGKPRFIHFMHTPLTNSESACQAYVRSLTRLKEDLEVFGEVEISDDSLVRAIETYNRMRKLLLKIYNLRKRVVPPISGSESLRITMAAFCLTKDDYIEKLGEVANYLEQRGTAANNDQPRLLVTSDKLYEPAYLELIEEIGALVVMDDFDTGSRYFWDEVSSSLEPMYALSKRYINAPADPRCYFMEEKMEQLIAWSKDFNVKGILNLPQQYDYARLYAVPYYTRRLNENGIPNMTFIREYCLRNVGQLTTRIEAFLEMLG